MSNTSDAHIWLYNSTNVEIDSATDTSSFGSSNITCNLIAEETYYLVERNY